MAFTQYAALLSLVDCPLTYFVIIISLDVCVLLYMCTISRVRLGTGSQAG